MYKTVGLQRPRGGGDNTVRFTIFRVTKKVAVTFTHGL